GHREGDVGRGRRHRPRGRIRGGGRGAHLRRGRRRGRGLTSRGRGLRALPKAHLHLHFTGSMQVETVREMATGHGMRLPEVLRGGYPPQLSAADERGWFRFQRLYDAARHSVQGAADTRRMVREAALTERAEGRRWLEIPVATTSHAPVGRGLRPALETV